MNTTETHIEYDDSTHTYKVNGVPVPSVTQVLRDAGLSDFSRVEPAILAAACARGESVHLACQYDDQNDLEESALAPEILSYVAAWRNFKRHFNFEPEWFEGLICDPVAGYAGHYDRVGHCRGTQHKMLLDIKTGEYSPSWGLQLAAYARALPDPLTYARCAVQLRPTGDYRVHHFHLSDFARDVDLFLAALRLFHFKREHFVDRVSASNQL